MSRDPKSSYYDVGGIETLDVIKAKLTATQYEGYLLGNVMKYVLRAQHKGQKDRDVEKIVHYASELSRFLRSLEPPIELSRYLESVEPPIEPQPEEGRVRIKPPVRRSPVAKHLRVHRAKTHKDRKKDIRRSVKAEAKAFRRDLDEGGLT